MNHEFNVINLDQRQDRLNKIKRMFSQFEFVKLRRFSAISHKIGWIGCALSHIRVVKEAKNRNLDYVIVLEDDTYIRDPVRFKQLFPRIMNYLQNNLEKWDLFQGNSTYSHYKPGQRVTLADENLNIISYQYGRTTNFIIYNKSIYDKLLSLETIYSNMQLTSYEKDSFDVRMLSGSPRILTVLPFLSYQYTDLSNIENRVISYDDVLDKNQNYLMKRLLSP